MEPISWSTAKKAKSVIPEYGSGDEDSCGESCSPSSNYDSSLNEGWKIAAKRAKKVSTFCAGCEGNPFMCLDCFNVRHHG